MATSRMPPLNAPASTITGLTATRITFGSSAGGLTQSSSLVFTQSAGTDTLSSGVGSTTARFMLKSILVGNVDAGGVSFGDIASGNTLALFLWTNGSIRLTCLSTGVWKFAAASFTANATTATTMTSLGPAGAGTTIAEWLTIQNAAGTVRYIPCY